jgi:hypothetical protein
VASRATPGEVSLGQVPPGPHPHWRSSSLAAASGDKPAKARRRSDTRPDLPSGASFRATAQRHGTRSARSAYGAPES